MAAIIRPTILTTGVLTRLGHIAYISPSAPTPTNL
jgi:hypothetical protein